MKAVVLQEDLLKSLVIVSRFVSTKAQIPVLSNILLSTEKGKIRVAATNLEMGISLQIGAKIEKDGAITVPAKIVVDLISNLPPGQVVLEEKQGQLLLLTPSFSAKLAGVSASEFPQVPDKIEKEDFSFSQAVLQEITKQTVFSAAVDDGRPILTGILFWFGESLKVVSTDGFRLSYKTISLGNSVVKKENSPSNVKNEFKMIVPARTIEELSRILTNQDEEVKVGILEKEKQLLFSGDSAVLTGKLLEGDFPDFEKIMPRQGSYKAVVDKNELERAVKSAAVFARESASIIKIKFSRDSLIVTAESQQYGQDIVTVEAKTEGGEIEIAYNYRYILDFIASIKGDGIFIQTEGAASPSIFKDIKDASYVHLIMPVRIQN